MQDEKECKTMTDIVQNILTESDSSPAIFIWGVAELMNN